MKATIFIDDIRASNASEEGVKNDTKKIKEVFAKAGWTFNNKKETEPNQEVYYLGFRYNSNTQRYMVHPGKLSQIERRIENLEKKNSVTPREIMT